MNGSNKKTHSFFEKLLEAEADNTSTLLLLTPSDGEASRAPDLHKILGMPHLSSIAFEALDALEELGKDDENWQKLKWRIWAFVELQDIFEMPMHQGWEKGNIFNSWYFYYESKFLLFESLLVGLNGYYHSSISHLRNFLEFSLVQNYFYKLSMTSGSYFSLDEYFKTGYLPKWGKLVSKAFPKNEFCETIKNRLDIHYRHLSNSNSHPYLPKDSPSQLRNTTGLGHTSYGLLYFWRMIDNVLEPILWMYYANFPMLLHPKDIRKKFGFNRPMGIFVDSSQRVIFEKTFRGDELQRFRAYTLADKDVESLTSWYNSFPELSLDEIIATWNSSDGPIPEDIEGAFLMQTARSRLIREIQVFSFIKKKDYNLDDFPNLEFSFDNWDQIRQAKNNKKKRK